jgi:predicted phosphodiesterase
LTLLAVLSDIHGNGIAMEQFAFEVDKIKPDAIICLGDTLGYLDEEIKCYEILEKIHAIHLMGNHEAMALGIIEINSEFEDVYKLNDAKSRLSIDTLKNIRNFPREANLIDRNFKAEFYHGNPADPLNGRVYFDTKIEPKNNQTNFIFVGNTHRSFSQTNLWGKVINVGSLGLPRDNGSLGTFVLVDTEKNLISRQFIDFNLDKMFNKYRFSHRSVLENFHKREKIADFN